MSPSVGSRYTMTMVDATGASVDGGRSSRLPVPPNVPVNNIWSVVVCDTQTRSVLQTDQERPTDLPTNEDGPSTCISAPNRGPTATTGSRPCPGWFAIIRLYGSLEPWFDKTWRLPDIKPVCAATGGGEAV